MNCIWSRSLHTRLKADAVKGRGDTKLWKNIWAMGILAVSLTTTYCVLQWVIHVTQRDESLIGYGISVQECGLSISICLPNSVNMLQYI